MTTLEFVAYLQRLDVKLWVDSDWLRFSAPEGVLTPDLRLELTNRKTEILALFREAHDTINAVIPPIRPISRDEKLPLSFAQQRLWFLDQLEPGNTAYNIPSIFRILGSLDITALEKSCNEIVRRHEILRTSFSIMDGQPVQVIVPTLECLLRVITLDRLPKPEQESEVRRQMSEEAQRPFDLTQSPLFRVSLLRLDLEEHVLLLTMHHIISDGWSLGVFYQELSTLYTAFTSGQPSPLAELSIQYADFAVWQRTWLKDEELEKQLTYWKQHLDGASPVSELPVDRPRPTEQTFQGAEQSMVLPKNLSQALQELSQQEGVTLFMTLLAAFKVLLYRYTSQEDIVVGSPIAGRNRAEIEILIGFFVNTLVLRTNLSGDPSFCELLTRLRGVCLGAYAHQDLPFEKLVEELQPERDLSRSPLFQIFFNMITLDDQKLELPGLRTEELFYTEPDSKFDITLYVRRRNEEIYVDFVYNAVLFSPERIQCLLEQFRYLLEQIIITPEKSIRSYSLVTPAAQPILPDPSIAIEEPSQEAVTSLFAFWAKHTPEHPAVSQGGQVWTYGELFEHAQRLALVLHREGVERGDVIAVYGPRSFALIASMIGIFWSRGVLLLVDRSLPNQRQQLMLREADAKIMVYIGDDHLKDAWLWKDIPSVIKVDPVAGISVDEENDIDLAEAFLPKLSGDDAAYIFFTSGSTGVPKGVLGCHKGLSHFLIWQRKTFAISPQDRAAQLTHLSFDVVLRDILLPLISGATLCLPQDIDDLGSDKILPWLKREQISILHTVPTIAQFWLANAPPEYLLSTMRRVFFAGEPLPDTLVRECRKVFPESDIVNLYGPTETTLAKCFYQVPEEILPGIQLVGRPMPQTQALILSENNQLCGIGEPGEIVIRTPFRTLGYVNAQKENQDRFVKNPFCKNVQDLLYYTGDRGRYRPDGSVEILGRLDFQVKIRGIRVEPNGVNSILSQHPAVNASVIIARKDKQEQNFLVAYVVTSKQETVTSSGLRSYLIQQLPAAIVPSTFVFLEKFPLTPNGKIDRSSLPIPDQVRSDAGKTFVAPRTPVEEILVSIWMEVLGVERVGIHDNFFELGGHSLLATQVISRLREIFQAELPLRNLFEAPTIDGLAGIIAQSCGGYDTAQEIARIFKDIEQLTEEEIVGERS